VMMVMVMIVGDSFMAMVRVMLIHDDGHGEWDLSVDGDDMGDDSGYSDGDEWRSGWLCGI
jgi:hypothetical protein